MNAFQTMLAALKHIVNDCPEPGQDAVLSAEGYNIACKAIELAEAGRITSTREAIRHGDAAVFGIVDGKEQKLFNYYIDELSIDHRDLVGLTPSEAIQFKRKKDVEYLRS